MTPILQENDMSLKFLQHNPEKSSMNQYWYSEKTIQAIVDEISAQNPQTCACLSTPSIYFSMTKQLKDKSVLFDYDKGFSTDSGFVFYDFNQPKEIPLEHWNRYDMIIIDPPFVTKEVWEKYAESVKLLVKKDPEGNIKGKILASTISENKAMMKELLDLERQTFQPSIPNLVYQYDFYINYQSSSLSLPNPEIPE